MLLLGQVGEMAFPSPIKLASVFALFAVVYTATFNVAVRIHPESAQSRFDSLSERGAHKRAVSHGLRALRLYEEDSTAPNDVAELMSRVGESLYRTHKYSRAAELMETSLATAWARELPSETRIVLEERFARALMRDGQLDKSIAIYASFLELAGDRAANSDTAHTHEAHNHTKSTHENDHAQLYADLVGSASDMFTESLNHASATELFGGTKEAQLAAAKNMAQLGTYFALREEGRYAAAGLLSTALRLREHHLGAEHQQTVQIILLLGPVYEGLNRLHDAEKLYLSAFHAQEKTKGSNSPDLSLYIKLLASNYEKQGRLTEAQALQELLRNLFRDAFGEQRYAANRETNRIESINRPVSEQFVLAQNYRPSDLVSAANYSIPVSKSPHIDEMKLRFAPDKGVDPREANLVVRLAQLVSLCRSESDERISLRSGYRSFNSQAVLYERFKAKGTVTPPGMSEHQTGLAVDIDVNGRFMRQSDRAYQCFEENAYRYGFILTYPPGNTYLPGHNTFEPWHWRYVGVYTAQLYREIGPQNKPQEFLAALPCYEARAESGDFLPVGEQDVCLSGTADSPRIQTVSADAPEDNQPRIAADKTSARILNKIRQ